MHSKTSERGEYGAELGELRERVLLMGAKVEEMLARSLRVLWTGDEQSLAQALAVEPQIDQLELDLDDRCLRLLARFQPVASDLRLITTTLKVVTQLERIGDLAEQLCRVRTAIDGAPPAEVEPVLRKMADAVTDMLRDALDAFATRDPHRAEAVIANDRTVDAFYAQSFPVFMRLMIDTPEAIDVAIQLQSVAKALERVGDQVTNIAEMVVFMVRGRDVRHDTAGERALAGAKVQPASPGPTGGPAAPAAAKRHGC
jgi:phosphate transport system protein